jgi:putative pyruvate formate lyase activating enzyme
VGPLLLNRQSVAVRGVLLRPLVLPNDLAGSRSVIDAVAPVAAGAAINIMAQYRPAHLASAFPLLRGRPAWQAIHSLRQYAAERGLLCIGD